MLILSLRRFIYSLPTLLFILILVFSSVRMLPGDPVDYLLGEKGASSEIRQELRAKLGLDQPIYIQFFIFIKRALKGDLGTSTVSGRAITEEFFDRFPATVELALSSLFLAMLLGLPLGILSAVFRNSFLDRFVMGISLTGYSMSIFWWGLVLILLFSIQLGWTPISGRIDVYHDVIPQTGFMLLDAFGHKEPMMIIRSFLIHLVLPTLTLATIPFVHIVRITRTSLIECLQEDFIRTARAKGLSDYHVIVKHALRNSLIPVITVIGFMFGTLVTGAVLTETIFSWPGIGHWLVKSVLARDYFALQGGVLIIALFIVVINLIVDLTYMKINPQVQVES